MQGACWWWGIWMYRFRWLVALTSLGLLLAFAPFAYQAPDLLKDNGFTPKGSEADYGSIQLQNELGHPPSTLQLVYTANHIDLTEPSNQKRVMDSLESVKSLPDVDFITPVDAPRLAGHSDVMAVTVALHLPTDAALERYSAIQQQVKAPDGMNVYITGGPAILYDVQEASKRDIAKAEAIGLPIALLVLLIVFGTLVAAMLPLIVGLISVTVTLGITYFIAQHHSLSNFLPNMVTMLGLAVGTDYALFLVSRFREELIKQSTVADAVAMTCQTAGKSILFSGIAVLIGLLGMLFVDLTFFRSLCLGGAIVVSISVIAANTMLLSLLGLLGHRINSLRVLPARFRKQEQHESLFWEKIAYWVMKRSILLVVLVGTALILFLIPFGEIKLNVPNAEVLPPGYESRYGSDVMKQAYDTREMNPIQVVVQTKSDMGSQASIRQIREYESKIASLAGVKKVRSYLSSMGQLSDEELSARLSDPAVQLQLKGMAKGNTVLLLVSPTQDPDDPVTDSLVKELRRVDTGELTAAVTGGPAYRLDMMDRIQSKIFEVFAFVMGVTYIVLLIAFRSVLLPLKAVLMNVLSLGASMGTVVLVFQYGWMADLLRITSIGYVSATLPVIIFCVVFGISMDYEVFLISRIMEEYEVSGDNEMSTARGLTKTGSLITSAAFILVVVVGSFIFTDIEIMKALGLGLGFAVLIDATVIRVMLVPALMKLLGKANWWAPAWLTWNVRRSGGK
ncbi:MMPL family transporter [Paenibacillus hexagrammi]|uniref:MMPL family transporter n=1 Tax=Paenibacillus hexagrammi TaxID=2908839 RepID=A0ABY3SNA3_9BACL|nr:MMPL family transporter [Paenibacillus sp. YPD9-1]UJF34701.1 MMPL family transporter [Paenibacillus sp. YPD9-1]